MHGLQCGDKVIFLHPQSSLHPAAVERLIKVVSFNTVTWEDGADYIYYWKNKHEITMHIPKIHHNGEGLNAGTFIRFNEYILAGGKAVWSIAIATFSDWFIWQEEGDKMVGRDGIITIKVPFDVWVDFKIAKIFLIRK